MIGPTEKLIDRPASAEREGAQLDVLAEVLSSMRLSGAVFLDGEMGSPWSILSHLGPEDCAAFFSQPAHVIAYHFVRSGRLWCRIGSETPVEAAAGEIVLLPRNAPHILHGSVPTAPIDARALMQPPGDDGLLRVRCGGDGERTSIYCGYLGSTTPDNALLSALPAIMKVDLKSGLRGDWMVKSLEFATESLGANSPQMVGKLAEELFAEAVRRYADALPQGKGGWLAGLRDPAVGKVLALIHGRYAEAWTVDLLAREAGVSKTVLADRFRATIGDAPMQYCGRWRMRVAADMLRGNRQNTASIAYSVGFSSEAAFNRAFKREYGIPPATWRRESSAP
jgi:AraC-like DNA-binding protein